MDSPSEQNTAHPFQSKEDLQNFLAFRESSNNNQTRERARNRFIETNVGLVGSIARRFHTATEDAHQDLVQQGIFGLLTAMERFDIYVGVRFSTYATWWISQEISRYIENNNLVVRRSVSTQAQIRKIGKICTEFSKEHYRDPTLEEIQEVYQRTGQTISIRCINRYLSMSLRDTSLQGLIGEDLTLEDILSGQGDPETTTMFSELRALAVQAIEAAERCVIHMLSCQKKRNNIPRLILLGLRFGLFGCKRHTLEAVGNLMGHIQKKSITREAVRQICVKQANHFEDQYGFYLGDASWLMRFLECLHVEDGCAKPFFSSKEEGHEVKQMCGIEHGFPSDLEEWIRYITNMIKKGSTLPEPPENFLQNFQRLLSVVKEAEEGAGETTAEDRPAQEPSTPNSAPGNPLKKPTRRPEIPKKVQILPAPPTSSHKEDSSPSDLGQVLCDLRNALQELETILDRLAHTMPS